MKFLPEPRCELGSSIRHDCFGNPMKTNDTRHVYVSQLVGSVGGADRNKVRHFSQPIDNDHNGIIPRLDLGKPVIKSIPTSSHFHSGILRG